MFSECLGCQTGNDVSKKDNNHNTTNTSWFKYKTKSKMVKLLFRPNPAEGVACMLKINLNGSGEIKV